MIMIKREAGKAWGFFFCIAEADEINRKLPEFRERAGVSSTLELALFDLNRDPYAYKGFTELFPFVELDADYAIHASITGKDNREVAGELDRLIDQIGSSDLAREGFVSVGPFFKHDGEYIEYT